MSAKSMAIEIRNDGEPCGSSRGITPARRTQRESVTWFCYSPHCYDLTRSGLTLLRTPDSPTVGSGNYPCLSRRTQGIATSRAGA